MAATLNLWAGNETFDRCNYNQCRHTLRAPAPLMRQVSVWSIRAPEFESERSHREAIAMSDLPHDADEPSICSSWRWRVADDIIWVIILPDGHQRNVVLIWISICSAFLARFSPSATPGSRKGVSFFPTRRLAGLDWQLSVSPFPAGEDLQGACGSYEPIRRSGGKGVLRKARSDRAGSTLLVAIFLTIIVIQYASIPRTGQRGITPMRISTLPPTQSGGPM